MKRGIMIGITTVIGSMILSGCGTQEPAESYYQSVDEVTMESIQEKLVYDNMLGRTGHLQIISTEESTIMPELGTRTTTYRYVQEQDITRISQNTDYSDGSYLYAYYSNDPEDPVLYMVTQSEQQTQDITSDQITNMLHKGYYTAVSLDQLSEVEEGEGDAEGLYQATIVRSAESGTDGEMDAIFELLIDPTSGYIEEFSATLFGEEAEGYPWTLTAVFDYTDEIKVDETAKNRILEDTGSEDASLENSGDELKVAFDTVDIQGNAIDDSILADAKLVMLNFWEPWCGPCVSEMPELQKLQDDYRDQGLLIIGAFSYVNMLEDAQAIVDDNEITYPIIQTDEQLGKFTLEYFPTTYLADNEGNLLTEEGIIGAHSYEDWEAIILEYLN